MGACLGDICLCGRSGLDLFWIARHESDLRCCRYMQKLDDVSCCAIMLYSRMLCSYKF